MLRRVFLRRGIYIIQITARLIKSKPGQAPREWDERLLRCWDILMFSNHYFRSQRLVSLTQAGDKLPDATVYEGTPKDAVKIRDVFKGKKGVLFGVPGTSLPTHYLVTAGVSGR